MNNRIEQACPVCRLTTHLKILKKLFDDRYGYKGKFPLLRCNNCGHKFLQVTFSSEQISTLYSQYYPRSSLKVETYRPHEESRGINAWLNGVRKSAYCWVPPNVRVLDIGCGFGETLAYHKKRGCDVYGVETDENIRRIAEKFGFNVHVGLFDPAVYEPAFFDYVTMDQVIEHVTDPIATLKGIAKILKPGGMAILSTPNPNGWGARIFGRKWINWHVPYHLQHFSPKSLEIAAKKAGLVIKRCVTITSSQWLYYQWLHLVTYPHIGKPSPFWSPKTDMVFWQKVAVKITSLVHSTKINHIITRVFDALEVGDNLIFVLKKS